MTDDWQTFVHEQIRSPELRRLPPGARTVLSGGAAGGWYFDWFESGYPSQIDRHIAVEALASMPDELPHHVEWLQRSLGDLSPVADDSVDLVFAGEVLEHLWPEDIAGFLLEARRVLRRGGSLVLDSPNRRVTTAVDWLHPEHTVEFTPDEIVELLAAAGFDEIGIRGAWLTYDASAHRFLPLEQLDDVGAWSWQRRLAEAADRPEDSFIWWVRADVANTPPQPEHVHHLVWRAFSIYRSFRFARLQAPVGRLEPLADGVVVRTDPGVAGLLVTGPTVPMRPGLAAARFSVGARGAAPPATSIVRLEVTSDLGSRVHACQEVSAASLPGDGAFTDILVPFDLDRVTFGVDFRITSIGNPGVSVDALCRVTIEPADTDRVVVADTAPQPVPARTPALRAVLQTLLWPLRRFFDPRFGGLATQIDTQTATLERRIDAAVRNLEGRLGPPHR